jgi:hypothetical protein
MHRAWCCQEKLRSRRLYQEKQAILSGMCKKHHDHSNMASTKDESSSEDEEELSARRPKSVVQRKKASHNRGLSIFQELSADAVSSMLNDAPAIRPLLLPPGTCKTPL